MLCRIQLHWKLLKKLKIKYKKYSFLSRGSDERQFNSPGVGIPMTVLMRTKFDAYPEYHTSLDNFNVVTEKGLRGGYKVVKKVINILQNKIIPISKVVCEPMMSKRKLHPSISTGQIHQDTKYISDFINYSDGKNDLITIANLICLPKKKVVKIFKFLLKKKIIKIL